MADRLSFCLVDDVVTKGSTLLAAASRLKETYPQAKVTAFALVRTLGFVDNIDAIVEPVVGTIALRDDEPLRDPWGRSQLRDDESRSFTLTAPAALSLRQSADVCIRRDQRCYNDLRNSIRSFFSASVRPRLK